MPTPQILILNGSVRGTEGNSGAIAAQAAQHLVSQWAAKVTSLTLAHPMPPVAEVCALLESSDALLVISGVYWNHFGSPLQRFVEVMTTYENSPAFFGKPVACAVSMDSVGGFEVAAKIHAVFSGLGCWSPPCSTLVLSRVGQEAIAASAGSLNDPNEDVWRLSDLEIVLHNLVAAANMKDISWKAWPHVRTTLQQGEWPASGPLQVDAPRFI